MDVKEDLKKNTIRFLFYFDNTIICERFWKSKIEINFTQEKVDEVADFVETYLNKDFEKNKIVKKFTIRIEFNEFVFDEDIFIKNRPPKFLYYLDIKPILIDIQHKLLNV